MNSMTSAEETTSGQSNAGAPNRNEGFDALLAKAEQGDAQAQYDVGVAYYYGRGVMSNYREAVVWFRRAAWEKITPAHFYLGMAYYIGQGVPQDYGKAYECFDRANMDKQVVEFLKVIKSSMTPEQIAEAEAAYYNYTFP